MASKAQTAPTTPRAPKRTTEQQLTDVATKGNYILDFRGELKYL
jgi:hypothetical protein